MKNLILGSLLILQGLLCAKTIETNHTGNWNSTSTWGTNSLPHDTDTIHVKPNDTLIINTSKAKCAHLILNGHLIMNSATSSIEAQSIICSGNTSFSGNSSGTIKSEILNNTHALNIGSCKLIVDSIHNLNQLEFTSTAGSKTFGSIYNKGEMLNSIGESIILQGNIKNQGQFNWATGKINFINTNYISGNLMQIPSIQIKGRLIITDSLSTTKTAGDGKIINQGFFSFQSKTSDYGIDSLINKTGSTIEYRYNGTSSLIPSNQIDTLILGSKTTIIDQEISGSHLKLDSNALISIQHVIFPKFNTYENLNNSTYQIKTSTSSPSQIVFHNLEITTGNSLNLSNTDSLFIQGHLTGAGDLTNEKIIVYSGNAQQTVKKRDYLDLVITNTSIDTLILYGNHNINKLTIDQGNFKIGNSTIDNITINKEGHLLSSSSGITIKDFLIISGRLSINYKSSDFNFNNLFINKEGRFLNNSNSSFRIKGSFTNNGEFQSCRQSSCVYHFTKDTSLISGSKPTHFSKLYGNTVLNNTHIDISNAIVVEKFTQLPRSRLSLGMDSNNIAGIIDCYTYPNQIIYNSQKEQNIKTTQNRFHQLSIQNQGVKKIHRDLFIADSLTIHANATLKTDSFKIIASDTCIIQLKDTAHLILGHNYNSTDIQLPSNLAKHQFILSPFSTIVLSSKSDKTINCIPTYGHLTLDDGAVDSSSIKLSGLQLEMTGNLNLEESSQHLILDHQTINVAKNWTGTGDLHLSKSNFYLGGDATCTGWVNTIESAFHYIGSESQQMKIGTFNKVIINKLKSCYSKANLHKLIIDSLIILKGTMDFKGEESHVNEMVIEGSVVFTSRLQDKVFNNINIQPSGTFTLDYDKEIEIKGDIINQGVFCVKEGTITFSGTKSQTVSGTNSYEFYKLNLENDSSLIVNTDCQLKDTFNLQENQLKLNATLNILDQGAIINESLSKPIEGDANSWIICKETIPGNSTSNFKGIGITITATLPLGTTTISRSFTSNNLGSSNSLPLAFDISTENKQNLNASISFPIFQFENSQNESLALWRSTDDINWYKLGGEINATEDTIQLHNIWSFSKWVLGSDKLTSLSINQLTAEAKREDQFINIYWEVLESQEAHSFLIKASTNSQEYFTIKEVQPSSDLYYSYQIPDINQNITSLQLIERGNNSEETIYHLNINQPHNETPKITVHQNTLHVQPNKNQKITIIDANGKVILQENGQRSIHQELKNGVYFILIESSNNTITKKIRI